MRVPVLFLLLILPFSLQCVLSDADADADADADRDVKPQDVNDVLNSSEFNSSRSTFATMIDKALEKEFNETDDKTDG